jgi:hypothetical protein
MNHGVCGSGRKLAHGGQRVLGVRVDVVAVIVGGDRDRGAQRIGRG